MAEGFVTTIRGWGLGYLIAFIVLIICILLGFFLDKSLTNAQVLALARLL